jgi:hypothetical protein
MLGLLLAIIYVVWTLITGTAVVLETTVLFALSFLWWWYLVTCLILLIVPLFVFLCGAAATTTEQKGVGLACILISPIIGLLLAIRSALLLSSIWLIMKSSEAGVTFAEWNRQQLVAGIIVYVITLLIFRGSKSTSNN